MKRILLPLVILLFSFSILKAQYVPIPDAAFVGWLSAHGYGSCLSGNNLDTTCAAVLNATTISCPSSSINDLTGIQYFKSLTYLSCRYNNLTALDNLPATVTTLDVDGNQLASLGTLPPALFYLDCSYNHLISLPSLPNTLGVLNCQYNNTITGLPALPSTLQQLQCAFNQIAVIPALPSGLTDLECGNNQLTTLPVIPSTVTYLEFGTNQISTIPVLPAGLLYLRFDSNPVSTLPANLPAGLISLNCGYTLIHTIPSLPATLSILNCTGDSLSAYPVLPPALNEFACSGVPLPVLPNLPSTIKNLDCSNTPISSIPELPDSLYALSCGYCYSLYCLPQLKTIRLLNFVSTPISCLPDYGHVYNSSPSLGTLPLCDIFNTHGCGVYWNISGKVYVDDNNNCIADSGEAGIHNVKVQLYQSGSIQQQANTVSGGEYSFKTDLLPYFYAIDTANLPFLVSCPTGGFYTSNITALDSFDAGMDFGLRCKPGFDLAAVSAAARFRPGITRVINVIAGDLSNYYYEGHCAAGVAGTVQLIINGSVSYVSPAPGARTPDSVSNDTITWNIADFGTVNAATDFNIVAYTATSAHVDSVVCLTLIVTPTAGDNKPVNNILTICFTISNSLDPNVKEVYPAGNIDVTQDWLTYTINFQNTGTDTALQIYIDDTLDNNLDASAFQLLAYSNEPLVQIKNSIVRFNFPNINLPDSNTNEPASHGYVQYKVKLKNNSPVGTHINNTAYIYFDFNAPVVTNTTSNTITTSTGITQFQISNPKFQIYPNPASNAVNIVIDETLIGSSLTITDITGREVNSVLLSTAGRELSTASFSNGIYFVSIRKDGVVFSQKLVVQR